MEKEQKTVTQIYGAFVAAIVLNFVPVHVLQLFGFVLMLTVLIAAYVYRTKADKDSLVHNHMTYLIGTIWISSLFICIGMALAGIWIGQQGDMTHIDNIVSDMNQGATISEAQMQAVFMDYFHANKQLLVTAGTVTLGPGILYLLYRTAKGVSRAAKGYRMANAKGWF